MNNFNLKYLVGAILLLSALMIIGTLVIGFINARSEKFPSLNAQPAIPAVGGEAVQPVQPERAIPLP